MEETHIRLWSGRYREVRALYLSAFPPEERFPFFALWLLSAVKRPMAMRAWRDGETCCGFACTVDTGKYLYLSFLAVAPQLRGGGYGGRILAALRERYPDRALIVEIEPVDEPAANGPQRRSRLEFYQKNGFYDLDRRVTGGGQTYSILSTSPDFDGAEYWRIFERMSLKWLVRAKRLEAPFRRR